MSPRSGWRGTTRTVGGSDLENRALGHGDPTSADRSAGKARACYSSINLTTGAGAPVGTVSEYDVPHTLGEIPTGIALDSSENAAVPGTFIEANAARRENWSHSHCHVSIRLNAGSFDGCVARFLVKGK